MSKFTQSIASLKDQNFNKLNTPVFEKDALSSLKRLSFGNLKFISETDVWDIEGHQNFYLQNTINTDVSILGVPMSFNLLNTNNFPNTTTNPINKFQYNLNYSKDVFLNKLGINKEDLNKQLTQKLNFDNQLIPTEIVKQSIANMPTMASVLGKFNCSIDELVSLGLDEFKQKYGTELRESKLKDIDKLTSFYKDYQQSNSLKDPISDSIINSKINSLDSQRTSLLNNSNTYKKLLALKEKTDALMSQINVLKKEYDEKVKVAMNGYNTVRKAIKNSNDLTSLQKFAMNVKGLNIGQHTLTTGNLVLKNYLQNGATFEYETESYYLLLTKGSQNKIFYNSGYVSGLGGNSSGTINEYYQFNNKYNLTGISVGRGSADKNFNRLSYLSFEKISNGIDPQIFQNKINIITLSNQYKTFGGQKLSYDVSKSFIERKPQINSNQNSQSANNSLAASIVYEFANQYTTDRQKLAFFYASSTYNNPGINGGINRPGYEFIYSFSKRVGKKIKISNTLNLYSFKYGESVALKSFREKFDISYKLKKSKVGMIVNTNFANQIQYNPKISHKTNALDVLATYQQNKRIGKVYINSNMGIGYGFTQQEEFNKSKNISLFINSNLQLKQIGFDFSLDKFNTRNTEIFVSDSTALMYVSTFNCSSSFSYSTNQGNIFQAGFVYKKYNSNLNQMSITALTQWQILKRINIRGNLSLPLTNKSNPTFVNNIFNSTLIYNINGKNK